MLSLFELAAAGIAILLVAYLIPRPKFRRAHSRRWHKKHEAEIMAGIRQMWEQRR